jgi:aerobic-type carbon monoxide dehydrogenase small subunit (CoxS/CutS family)
MRRAWQFDAMAGRLAGKRALVTAADHGIDCTAPLADELGPRDVAVQLRRLCHHGTILHYLSGNLCRCGSYARIIEAVSFAARKRKAA